MIGAVIFVIFFLAFLGISLGMPTLPPGPMIFSVVNIPRTALENYPVLGVPASLLIIGIVNGVVYGFIIWLIFSVVSAATGRNKKKGGAVTQSVTVNVGEKAESSHGGGGDPTHGGGGTPTSPEARK